MSHNEAITVPCDTAVASGGWIEGSAVAALFFIAIVAAD
jgi:hypothetical protein